MTPRTRAPLKPIPPECLCLAGCGRRKSQNNGRGLCYLCYQDPAARAAHPSTHPNGRWANVPKAERDPDTMAGVDALIAGVIAEGRAKGWKDGLPDWWHAEWCLADAEVGGLMLMVRRAVAAAKRKRVRYRRPA